MGSTKYHRSFHNGNRHRQRRQAPAVPLFGTDRPDSGKRTANHILHGRVPARSDGKNLFRVDPAVPRTDRTGDPEKCAPAASGTEINAPHQKNRPCHRKTGDYEPQCQSQNDCPNPFPADRPPYFRFNLRQYLRGDRFFLRHGSTSTISHVQCPHIGGLFAARFDGSPVRRAALNHIENRAGQPHNMFFR